MTLRRSAHRASASADGNGVQLTLPPIEADAFASARLSTAFMPVVSLDSGEVLGSEALLRADVAGRDVPPLLLMRWARARGTLAELDLEALECALAAAGRAGGGVVLVNVEPSTLAGHTDAVIAVLERRHRAVHAVVEVTERAIAADPAGLLRATEALHAKGYPLALDDVGTNPQSLAMLEIIRPGIVKLDMSLLREHSDPKSHHVAGAVAGYAESVGASIIAGGIETPQDVMRARILGANLGQGSLWGHASERWPQQAAGSPLRFVPPHQAGPRRPTDTPFSLISRHKTTHTATPELLLPLSLAVEAAVEHAHLPAILLASVQHVSNIPPSSRDRFARLAHALPVVGVLGNGVTSLGIPGAHLAHLDESDPLCREWNVVALCAQGAVALTAREQPAVSGQEPVYAFTTTRDRALVVAAAATLVARL